MGAGTVVDGRAVTKEILEQKIAETLALSPSAYGKEHSRVKGRENAAEIIEAVGSRQKKFWPLIHRK
jgi:hypothetical protein